jgi:hypothetical protein
VKDFVHLLPSGVPGFHIDDFALKNLALKL